jgi:hypothetical protein
MKIPEKLMPRVGSISDERNSGDGYWIYLANGWYNEDFDKGCTIIHEHTVKECLSQLRSTVYLPNRIS